MGEMTSKANVGRLRFLPAAPTTQQAVEGVTVYEAEAQGVKYRVEGAIVDPLANSVARRFRAYRVTLAGRLYPAGLGGEHRTLTAACTQAEDDLVAVLADRATEPATATRAPIRDALDRVVSAAVREAVEAAVEAANDRPDPATDDDVDELVERIVRRAQYLALRAVLAQLDGWIDGARENCVGAGHGAASSHDDGLACGQRFDVSDIRSMIAEAARELRVPLPSHG
jgi:hypothetical protein